MGVKREKKGDEESGWLRETEREKSEREKMKERKQTVKNGECNEENGYF